MITELLMVESVDLVAVKEALENPLELLWITILKKALEL
jgi:hypothetical protein